MITKEDVVQWMQANPKEFRELHLAFVLGVTAGEMISSGYSADGVRTTLECALSVSTEGYQQVTGTSLRVVPPPADGPSEASIPLKCGVEGPGGCCVREAGHDGMHMSMSEEHRVEFINDCPACRPCPTGPTGDFPVPDGFFGPEDEQTRCVHCGATYAEHDSVSPCTETYFTDPSERITHLVVIAREGVPEVTEFHSVVEAEAFFQQASLNWTESYLCSVLRGPRP